MRDFKKDFTKPSKDCKFGIPAQQYTGLLRFARKDGEQDKRADAEAVQCEQVKTEGVGERGYSRRGKNRIASQRFAMTVFEG